MSRYQIGLGLSGRRVIVTEQRHTYITLGISRETFVDIGCRATSEDPDLTYVVHKHSYDPYGETPCNGQCTTIRGGQVTQLDAAES